MVWNRSFHEYCACNIGARHERLFAPGSSRKARMDAVLTQVVVTGVGHWRGEGLALVEAVR
jgi:hypothetical protein